MSPGHPGKPRRLLEWPRCHDLSLPCIEMRLLSLSLGPQRSSPKFERPAATSTDPEKRSCSTANLALRQKQHKLLYWFLPPDSFPMRFETTRIVYFVKLKHASRTFFNLKLQRTAFHSKNAPKKCSQSSPRAPKTSPKCLRELPGDVLRGHTHLQSGRGASPIRQSGQSVINSSKVEHPPGHPWGPF